MNLYLKPKKTKKSFLKKIDKEIENAIYDGRYIFIFAWLIILFYNLI